MTDELEAYREKRDREQRERTAREQLLDMREAELNKRDKTKLKSSYQGPVPEGANEKKFRRTGKTEYKKGSSHEATQIKEEMRELRLKEQRRKIARANFKRMQRERKQKSKIYNQRIRGIQSLILQGYKQKARRYEQPISESNRAIFEETQRIQRKAFTDNQEHERRIRERARFSRMVNLLKAHTNMVPQRMDFTDTSEKNSILKGGLNIMARRPDSINILKTNRKTILSPQDENILRPKLKLRF